MKANISSTAVLAHLYPIAGIDSMGGPTMGEVKPQQLALNLEPVRFLDHICALLADH